MDRFLYKGRKTNEISFPLGGIGTGCIGLAGNGRLVDWEIFNRASKCSLNGFSHFAIKAEAGGKMLDARVLNGDLHAPYMGGAGHSWCGYGYGPRREHMAGMPHFKEVEFRGEFPVAQLAFKGAKFPGKISMTAFNPFIPLNDIDSGIPAAFFEFEIKNPTKKTITYTLAGSVANPFPQNSLNTVRTAGKSRMLHLTTDAHKKSEVGYGDITLATDATDTSSQQYWFSSAWFDSLEIYWRDFIAPGRFKNRTYKPGTANANLPGILAAHVRVKPGRTKRVRFVIAWNKPNCENYWDPNASCDCGKGACASPTWKNYYATIWKNSLASASYALKNWDRLQADTLRFKNSLFASDLPPAALDAVSSTLSVLKTATVMRLEDGTFYGWEGCQSNAGCCEGSCDHVWNYAQALPFLFPKLERSMREADYKYNQQEDGCMPFRILLPLGRKTPRGRACGDGLFGGVMKVYRDWKICGDTEWLKKMWPAVKKSIEFAWAPTNEDKWDPDKTGVLQGRQHHTLDVELFGPNSWITGFYLGALKAGAEMADHLGEPDTATEFREIFDRGKAWTDEHLFNGEYYHQVVDLDDKSVLDGFAGAETYWDDEHKEIKYQIGEGSEIDQILAQWHANLYGLGEVFDPKQVKTALKSIFKNNFCKVMREQYNPCRIYCINDEAGLLVAYWPPDRRKPMVPIPYSGETQNGYEYAAATQMIQTGLVKEGMTAITALRDRYDGEKRNPWNEFECGNNYARSMAAYSLLNTFAGFQFNMVKGEIGFNPVKPNAGRFRSFWSLECGWGEFEMKPGSAEVRLLQGGLKLKALDLPFAARKKIKSVKVAGKSVAFVQDGGTIRFKRATSIKQGQALKVSIS